MGDPSVAELLIGFVGSLAGVIGVVVTIAIAVIVQRAAKRSAAATHELAASIEEMTRRRTPDVLGSFTGHRCETHGAVAEHPQAGVDLLVRAYGDDRRGEARALVVAERRLLPDP